MSVQKSTAMKLFEGVERPGEIKNNPAPTTPARKPRGLGREAGKLWDQLIPQLETLNLATGIDETMLVGLVNWWQHYVNSEQKLAQLPPDTKPIDVLRAQEWVRKAWNEYRRLAELFGISPVARSGIHVETKNSADDDLAALKL